jgi:hypothetical protein
MERHGSDRAQACETSPVVRAHHDEVDALRFGELEEVIAKTSHPEL